jgi:hypothetical protein
MVPEKEESLQEGGEEKMGSELGTWAPGTCHSAPCRSYSGSSLWRGGSAAANGSLCLGPSPQSSCCSQKFKGCSGYWGRRPRRPWGPRSRKARGTRSWRPRSGPSLGLIPLVHPVPDEQTHGSASQVPDRYADCRDGFWYLAALSPASPPMGA